MNKTMEKYTNDYKKFGIDIEGIKKYDTPINQAKNIEKFSLLKNSNIAYTSFTSILDKKDVIE